MGSRIIRPQLNIKIGETNFFEIKSITYIIKAEKNIYNKETQNYRKNMKFEKLEINGEKVLFLFLKIKKYNRIKC